jgi:hypothetical protein
MHGLFRSASFHVELFAVLAQYQVPGLVRALENHQEVFFPRSAFPFLGAIARCVNDLQELLIFCPSTFGAFPAECNDSRSSQVEP